MNTYLNTSIDDEFHCLLPLATKEEVSQLEKLLLAEGCRDPLVITKEGVVVDGMTRWNICKKHKLPFQTVVKEFESRLHIRIWIRETQGGRRNSTDAQRIENALELEKDRALLAKNSSAHVRSESQVIENTAVTTGVSKRTVNNFIAADASPVKELGRMMKTGDVSIRAAADVAKLPVKTQERIVIKGPSAVKAAAAAVRKKEPVKEAEEIKDSCFPETSSIDEAVQLLKQLMACVRVICGDGKERRTAPCGVHISPYLQELEKHIDEMRRVLRFERPYASCPYCDGEKKKCDVCKGCGWIGESSYGRLPKEVKAKVKETVKC